MAAYPAEYDFHVVLRDGGLARIRPVVPEDADRMKAMYRRMGRESIYHRFFSHKTDVSDEEIEYFSTVDYDDRMAFVAEIGHDIAAIGRYDRMEGDPTSAEVAFSVDDAHHGRGLGSHLLSHLTNYARNNGVSAFRAFVLPENYPMMRLFRGSGYRMKRGMGEGVYEVEFPVERSEEAMAVEGAHEQKSVAASLLPIFYPRSVAIIGASREHHTIGGRVMRNVLDAHFNGAVFPVNPNAPAVGSVKAYRSVLDIPDPIDVAVIVVPARFVIPVVEECAQKGVKGLVVISAGFSESSEAGEAMEQELLDLVRVSGMRMIGPNCMGMLNTDPAVNLDLTFAPTYPPRGNVSMSSQSGALGIAILDYADQLDIGIASFVSVGNSADVSANDLLLYWEGDPSTDVILLYVESFGQPRRFSRVARRIGKSKPIIAVKSGRTSAGARAASSHTGALASVEVAVSAVFRQSGVIRVDTLEQMFEAASLLANQPLPGGRRVAVLTNAGGPGILCVDALESEGLEVPEFSPELQARLQEHLSSDAAVRNPVDMIASAGPGHYEACLDALLNSDEIDSVIVIFIPTSPGALLPISDAVHHAAASGGAGKTLLTVFMEADAGEIPDKPEGTPRLPTYTFPEPAARALARAARYGEWRDRPAGEFVVFDDVDPQAAQEVIWEALPRLGPDGGWLEPNEAEAVLRAFGINQAASRVTTTREEAIEAAKEIGTSVVLKVIAPSALHKSDVGGIVLDVDGDDAVGEAFDQVMSVVDDAEGALVQEFVGAGHEVIIGMTEDPSFGPLIAFGLGGVFVELIGDVAFRIHPLTDLDTTEMISEVKSARLLEGYRGGPAGDIDALKDALLRLSALVEALPEVAEFDLNPVKVLEPGLGLRVVDLRMRVRPVPQRWLPSRKDIPAARMRGR